MLLLYKCNLCDNEIKKLFGPKDKHPPFLQCQCSGVLEKQLPEFSTSSVESVDNGTMNRRVELRKDASKKAQEKGDNYIKTMSQRDRVIKKDEN